MKDLEFDVSNLVQQSDGTSERYSLETPLKLAGLKIKSQLKTKVDIMRIEDGFNVSIEDFSIKLELECGKCLSSYIATIHVDSTERQFYFDNPQNEDDIADIYLVDIKHQKIDISEMIRQEILLHFPINQVCSDRCKGICQICGKNKNKEKCNCKKEQECPETQKPLAKLKELLK